MWVCIAALVHVLAYIIMKPVAQHGVKNGIITLKTEFIMIHNQDMCELLGVTKRTLARYRQKKLVTYYMIDGRTYYKASEVQDFLNKKGKVLPAKIKKELGLQS